MTYKTPTSLEMAVKQAAKDSPQGTNRAIAGFWHHRLLCRVFAGDNRSFVLKGGHAMLARTVDARATRDIDLLSTDGSLDTALEELKRLAASDLGDFATFEFVGTTPIKAEDEYRSGLDVRFKCLVGAKPVQDISIDLVIDEVSLEDVDVMAPVDRLDVRDIEVCDYVVYPVEYALADKLCGIIESHGGRPSSRVKDLVDIAVVASSMTVDGEKLQKRITTELGVRRLLQPTSFNVPDMWWDSYSAAYAKMAKQTHVAEEAARLDGAVILAKSLLDPAIDSLVSEKNWSPELKCWLAKAEISAVDVAVDFMDEYADVFEELAK